jgi:ferric iron reductase protein FhuF
VTRLPNDLLNDLSAIGPYFAVQEWTEGLGWRSFSELCSLPVFAERVAAAQRVLSRYDGADEGGVQDRVVASIVFLGIAARLEAPALAMASQSGVTLEVSPTGMWWQEVDSGPWPIAIGHANVSEGNCIDDLAARFVTGIVYELLAPLLQIVSIEYRLPRSLLWGNVASGLAGAMVMLSEVDPMSADRTARLVEEILTLEPLRGTGSLHHPDPTNPRRFFVRRSCCLFMRVPGAGTCGDCALIPEPQRLQEWEEALRQEP